MIIKLSDKVKIAGPFRVGHWKDIANKLNTQIDNKALWEQVFDDFFVQRISTRYINLIDSIEQMKRFQGEGFAIMTLACALIEFLEATRQGKIFSLLKTKEIKALGRDPKNYYSVSGSKTMFKSFLENREPFKYEFDTPEKLEDFYSSVRCGLMHEATVAGNWVINIKKITGARIVTYDDTQTLLNRINFIQALNDYIQNYKKELLNSNISIELRRAFLIKFNGLCEQLTRNQSDQS